MAGQPRRRVERIPGVTKPSFKPPQSRPPEPKTKKSAQPAAKRPRPEAKSERPRARPEKIAQLQKRVQSCAAAFRVPPPPDLWPRSSTECDCPDSSIKGHCRRKARYEEPVTGVRMCQEHAEIYFKDLREIGHGPEDEDSPGESNHDSDSEPDPSEPEAEDPDRDNKEDNDDHANTTTPKITPKMLRIVPTAKAKMRRHIKTPPR